MNHDHSQPESHPQPFWGSRYSLGLIVLGGIALYFLLSEHRAHFFGALPFLLLLACPLMHLFMHRGHHGHGGGHAHGQDDPSDSSESATPSTGKPGGQP